MKHLVAILFAFIFGTSSLVAQTTTPPVINCISTDANTGDVELHWTNPPPNACGLFVGYVIYVRNPGAGPPPPVFQVLDTITNINATSLFHLGANGTIADWEYFIISVYDCPGYTFTSSDTVQEVVFQIPSLDYVTVLPNGSTQINWTPNTSPQTAGYHIYELVGSSLFNPLDTIPGINSNSTTVSNIDPTTGSIEIAIEAYSNCGGISTSINTANSHNTIYLSVNANACNAAIELSWNNYINWPDNPDYELLVSLDGGTPTVVQTFVDLFSVGSPAGSINPYQYDVSGLSGDTIVLYINAIHPVTGVRSSSNRVVLPFSIVKSIAYNIIERVSVNANGGVDLDYHIDTSANLNKVTIEKSTDGSTFNPLDTIAIAQLSGINNYTDATANTTSTYNYYKITANDDCASAEISGTVRPIWLQGSLSNGVSHLSWSDLTIPGATVSTYTIYRFDANNNRLPLSTEQSSVFDYDDFVKDEITDDGQYCYIIEADYFITLPFSGQTKQLTSTSNILCLNLPPVVYIPNAFAPNGVNKFFKPVLLFRNVKTYQFRIFDRWGKELFFTENQIAGWDGNNNGETLPMGGYTYYLKIETLHGDLLEEKGVVFLVR